jgi:hypothetical protein
MKAHTKIAIDVDGVLADFAAGVVDAANSLWPGKLPRGYQPTEWNYTSVLTK